MVHYKFFKKVMRYFNLITFSALLVTAVIFCPPMHTVCTTMEEWLLPNRSYYFWHSKQLKNVMSRYFQLFKKLRNVMIVTFNTWKSWKIFKQAEICQFFQLTTQKGLNSWRKPGILPPFLTFVALSHVKM